MPKADCKFENYKISQRRDLDISTVNASFKFDIENNKIQSARIVYGGVGPTTIRLNQVEDQITGQDIKPSLVRGYKK